MDRIQKDGILRNDRKVVFFKVFSNLGIAHIPVHQHTRNDGVYFGPDAIVTSEFLNVFPEVSVHEFHFTKNGDVTNETIFETFVNESRECTESMRQNLEGDNILVTVGGDNTVCFPALISDFERFPSKNIGILDFDTHGDIHLENTSKTKNIHGMYLRPFFDEFDVPVVNALVSKKLQGDDIIYFGNFDFEKEESDFMNRIGIRRYSENDIRERQGEVEQTLREFLMNHDHIHINFDIDVFDATLVQATGIQNGQGLLAEDVFPLLALIKNHPSKTITLSEVNPELSGIEETVLLAQRALVALL